MPRLALGRKFDDLMKEAKAPPPSDEPARSSANDSPGMATLLRGGNRTARQTRADSTSLPEGPGADTHAAAMSAARHRKRLLQASLLLADLVLCALAVRVVRHGPLGFLGIAICVLALALGAWLTCLALWPEDQSS
jgi:hypothetical protein